MRTALLFPLAFVSASSILGCSFSMHAGTTPQNQPGNPSTQGGPRGIGKRTVGPAGPTPAPTTPVPATPVPRTNTVTTATIFGNNVVETAGYKGAVYWIPAGTTTLPALASMTPNGYVNLHELNIAPQTFTGGFPGLDSTHNSNFAIHYEAPLVVTIEADYDFRLVADDGAVLRIDSTSIVDNDGTKTAAASKDGPVHLVTGTHVISVDYFQATGPVALQLYCKKVGDAERVCPTSL